VLGFGGECYVDPWGRPYCDHDHTAAEPPLEDIYEKVQGWTAQSPTRLAGGGRSNSHADSKMPFSHG
jgi:hypothetical protein